MTKESTTMSGENYFQNCYLDDEIALKEYFCNLSSNDLNEEIAKDLGEFDLSQNSPQEQKNQTPLSKASNNEIEESYIKNFDEKLFDNISGDDVQLNNNLTSEDLNDFIEQTEFDKVNLNF